MEMSFFDIDKEFGELRKMMKKVLNIEEIEDEIANGKLQGGWNVKEIDEPDAKGYIIEGRFYSGQSSGDAKPDEPFSPNPIKRPLPQRPIRIGEEANENREPLTDIFEEEKVVKVYIELPGEEKDNIQLNVTEGKVEVRTKNFYKVIDVPTTIETEKSSAKYNNGVLTVTIPKKTSFMEEKKQKIRID